MFNLRGLSQQQHGRTMGPLAAQQKPKLWQLNYFTDKAELEALGPKRPVVVVVVEEGRREAGKVHTRRNRKGGRLKRRFEKCIDVKKIIIILFFGFLCI